MPVHATLAQVAADQWGLVTTAQAAVSGVSRQALARLVQQGVVDRVGHGVYRLAGVPPDEREAVRVAWLRLDPARTAFDRLTDTQPGVVSHRSAARLLGLGDLDADRHEITTAVRKQSRDPQVHLHVGRVPADEWTVVDGLPTTTAARTVRDLALAMTDGDHLDAVVQDARRHGLITRAEARVLGSRRPPAATRSSR